MHNQSHSEETKEKIRRKAIERLRDKKQHPLY